MDGYDIDQLDLQVLRSQMLLLNQEVALFDGSIRENIFVDQIGQPNSVLPFESGTVGLANDR